MSRAHNERCTTCGESFPCCGYAIDNHDGWPEVACSSYDRDGYRECENCATSDKCAWCGKPGELITDGDGDKVHGACMAERIEVIKGPSAMLNGVRQSD